MESLAGMFSYLKRILIFDKIMLTSRFNVFDAEK
jgi:hypothetical protein